MKKSHINFDGKFEFGLYIVILLQLYTVYTSVFQFYRYRADENGYVADVRYEGLVQPFVPPPPPPVEAAPAPLVKRNSSRIPKGNPVGKADGRPIVKRNENTSTDDYEFSTDINNVKEVSANKRQHKNQQQQKQRHQKQQKQQQPEYYQPQAYHPF